MKRFKGLSILLSVVLIMNSFMGLGTMSIADIIETPVIVANSGFEDLLPDSTGKWAGGMIPEGYSTYKPTNISPQNDIVFSIDEIEKHSGARSVKLSVDSSKIGRGSVTSPFIAVAAGKTYSTTVMMKTEDVTQARFRLVPYYSDVAKYDYSVFKTSYSANLNGTNGWTSVTVTWKIPTAAEAKAIMTQAGVAQSKIDAVQDADRMKIEMYLEKGVGSLWLDTIEVKEISQSVNTPVSNVSFDKKSITLYKGMTYDLQWAIAPVDATDKSVTFESSDAAVATVDAVGQLTAIKEGSAVITIKAEGGTKTDTATINVINETTPGNLIKNNGFEVVQPVASGGVWKTNYAPVGYTTYIPTKPVDYYIDETTKYSGAQSVKLEVPAGSTGRGSISTEMFPIAVGKTYKVKMRTKTVDLTKGRFRLVPYYISDTGSTVAYPYYAYNTSYNGGVTGTTGGANGGEWILQEKIWKVPTADEARAILISKGVSMTQAELDAIKDATFMKVDVYLEKGQGSMWIDELSAMEWIGLNGVSLNPDYSVMVGHDLDLTPIFDPTNASEQNVIWEVADSGIATIGSNGRIHGVSLGQTQVTVKSVEDMNKKYTTTINVMTDPNNIIDVVSVNINEASATIMEDQYYKLGWEVLPTNATNKNVTITSADTAVARISGEYIRGIGPGSTDITITSEDGNKTDTIHVTVTDKVMDKYDVLRENWKETLTGKGYDINDPHIVKMIGEIDFGTNESWSTMEKNINTPYLWSKYNSTTASSHVRGPYIQLFGMAKAYNTYGSAYYGDQQLLADTIYGLEWMYENRYKPGIKPYGNWWDWEIGTPVVLNNIVTLIYEELTPEQISKYMDTIYYYQPDPVISGGGPDPVSPKRPSVGANRVDTCKIAAVRGVLIKDSVHIGQARDGLSDVFDYVTTGDGFYEDGSFVQHGTIAYNGTYGKVLLDGIANILYLLNGTEWTVTDTDVNNIYNSVEKSYAPLFFSGAMMDMVNGRSISRSALQDHGTGHSVLSAIMKLALSAPDNQKKTFNELIKTQIQKDSFYNHIENEGNIYKYQLAQAILNDSSLTLLKDDNFHKQYSNMDRVVHNRKDYAFGISMHSSRIGNYESMNGENLKAWHTGDGMTYLYNSDLDQYMDFWPTVDSYRLPGTTEAVGPRKNAEGQRRNKTNGNMSTLKSWVGGAQLNDEFGAVGMDFISWNDTVTAKKSWFLFDNEIVALGSDITSNQAQSVETTIENRKLNDLGDNKILVDGLTQSTNLGWEEAKTGTDWVHLEGDGAESSIGYYFPHSEDVNIIRESRTGAWSDISTKGLTDVITKNYFTMYIDHGNTPVGAKYEYVLLPGATRRGISYYSKNPEIEILAQSSDVHAVRENTLNITAANFWNDKVVQADFIKVDKKASVMVKEDDSFIEVAISDPTMLNNDVINVELVGKEAANEIIGDPRVIIEGLSGAVKFKVDVKDAKGQTIYLKFNKSKTLLNANIEITNTDNMDLISIIADITNNTDQYLKTNIITELYNKKGKLVYFTYEEKKLEPEQSKVVIGGMCLPSKRKGYKLKIHTNDNILISKTSRISNEKELVFDLD